MTPSSALTPTVAALVSSRIDPVSQRLTRNPADAIAAALALRLSPAASLICAGDLPDAVARDYLALGAPSLTVLHMPTQDADPVSVLAPVLNSTPWVLCGARGCGHLGSGLLPYQLAQMLGRPLIENVLDVDVEPGPSMPSCVVRQALPRGARRRWRVRGPVVLVLSDRAELPLRYAYDAAQRGRIEHRQVAAPEAAPMHWTLEPSRRQLRPLAPKNTQSGHARMAGATGSATAPTTATVLREGSLQDKAQALLNHLRAQALIDC